MDEIHLFSSKDSIAAFKLFDGAVMRLGFSATPWKQGEDVFFLLTSDCKLVDSQLHIEKLDRSSVV